MADVVVDGVRLVYEMQGDGPPVLLIAGTGMPAAMWSMLATPHLLGAGYSVVAFDNRGIAPSDIPPPPYTVEEMAGDAIGLLEHLDLGPVAVLGASLGGTIAQNVALRRPDLVGAAIFMVGVGRVSALGAATIRALIELLELPWRSAARDPGGADGPDAARAAGLGRRRRRGGRSGDGRHVPPAGSVGPARPVPRQPLVGRDRPPRRAGRARRAGPRHRGRVLHDLPARAA